ncbi:hypothetical protein HO173_005611 [Letharia columbiana]|uniref:Uncharacterized protein n=1 Tax=Letharia columbiana TaxID=112416 RepID=A0A8H6L578_9LECA|nr:uncharacterized protein HO173_005611 [Letharia columbiana]KAF6235983.1 hypothetical protein HO173_005611 [Letharia columbiana]
MGDTQTILVAETGGGTKAYGALEEEKAPFALVFAVSTSYILFSGQSHSPLQQVDLSALNSYSLLFDARSNRSFQQKRHLSNSLPSFLEDPLSQEPLPSYCSAQASTTISASKSH